MVCPTTVYRPDPARDVRCAVFYLHGGGLVYGERDDLPSPYVRAFTDAGYTLICTDYPLAPETPLPGIVSALCDTWRGAVAQPLAQGAFDGYFLFGRSAGAYLALLLAREIRRGEPDAVQPRGVLSFYGYYDLTEPWVAAPAGAYAALPEVSRAQVERMTAPARGNGAVADAPTSGAKALRYALYVYARQHEGAWLELMGLDSSSPERTAGTWSLTETDLAALPPLFIAASTGDEDVPYRVSKQLARRAPDARMKSVYYLPHDFDRDVTDPAGMQAYQAALAWMDALPTR